MWIEKAHINGRIFMTKRHHPNRGSHGFSPRKRAKRETPKMRRWPDLESDEPKLQGFVGYKVGMTHGFVTDYRKRSTTSNQEVAIPITVVETPPMTVCGVRIYKNSEVGLQTLLETWADKLDKHLSRKVTIPPEKKEGRSLDELKSMDPDDVRVLAHTKPVQVTGIPKKKPEIVELRVGGATIDKRLEYAMGLLGKDIGVGEFTREGAMVDILAVTKGKGFQGHVKRFGVKLLSHKNSKHRRMVGTLGPWHPPYVMSTVPQAGQMGYHQRTEYNKRVLKIGSNPDEINPKGGFLHYGPVRNDYVLFHGSIPGPSKRLVKMRDPIRLKGDEVTTVELSYISTQSKQGA